MFMPGLLQLQVCAEIHVDPGANWKTKPRTRLSGHSSMVRDDYTDRNHVFQLAKHHGIVGIDYVK